MTSLPLARTDGGMPAVNVHALIEKAVDAKSACDVIERLMAMEATMQARRAEAEFDAAMMLFRSQCSVIRKVKKGAVANYAPHEHIEAEIAAPREANGFYHWFGMDEASEKGFVIVWCHVKHVGGHQRSTPVKMPLPDKTRAMNDAQQYIAAHSYAKRTALVNAYGIVIAGEDVDGNTAKPKPPGPSAMRPDDPSLKAIAQELWTLLKPIRGTEANWIKANQWLWEKEILDGAIPEEAPNLTANRFREVIEKAKKAI